MNVTGRVNRAGRVLVALGFVVGGMVFAGGEVAHAATGFVAPPTRSYMLPEAPSLLGLPSDVVTQLTNLLVPVKVMKFDGSTDLISQDVRKIEVDFPASSPDCNIAPNDSNFSADYAITNCTRIQMDVTNGRINVGALEVKYGRNSGGVVQNGNPAFAVYLVAGARVDIGSAAADEYNLNSRQGLPSLSINGTKAQINDALKLLEYKPNADYKNAHSNPDHLHMLLKVDGSNDPSPEVSVELRVQGFNDWPELKADHEVGARGRRRSGRSGGRPWGRADNPGELRPGRC